jgi:acyl carrier protein
MALDKEALFTFIDQKLGVDRSKLDDQTPIFSSGMVDSFSLVSLITFIEKQCGFRVNPMDVNLENLDTVDRIIAYTDRKTAEA